MYRMRSIAQQMRYIGPNHVNSINYLPFDIDHPEASMRWEDENIPPPNIITLNPENGHGHYLYALAEPVHFNAESSRRAQRYLQFVENGIKQRLGADFGYSGSLTKNPLNPHWPTLCLSNVAYDLDTLAAHLDQTEGALDLRRKVAPIGLGRNCTVFDKLRFFAYKERRRPDGWLGYEFFYVRIEMLGLAINNEFPNPLPQREIQGIAKSIAKWTWKNITPAGFRLWGENRRAKSIEVRQERGEERAQRIRELAREFPEATQRELAKMVGLSQWTVMTALKAGTT